MKNNSLFRRILSVVLVLTMLGTVLVPAASAAPDKSAGNQVEELTLTPIDPGELESHKLGQNPSRGSDAAEEHAPDELVRVSILLEKPATLDAGFKAVGIATNAAAKAYREGLRADQADLTARIEKMLGEKLDVKWNLTLATNIISANLPYGMIEDVKALDGVKGVFLETLHELDPEIEADEPQNGSASVMIGSNISWANGYTGAGSKVAVIDTGIDSEHQSFSGEGLEYALQKNAEAKGLSYEDYVATLNLLTPEKIDAVKDQLNANIGSGAAAYRNTKIAYGYNYVDDDVDYIEHVNDPQGEHGSHVEGIAAANRFIKVDGEFKPALETVLTQGVAPDAQIVTMKVFGKGGGAYDSDYMSAIEDAIVLGCDSANLSLGSGSPGFSFAGEYESVMNKLVANGMVCAFSAGNSGMWYDTPNNASISYPYLYMDDANYATGGSPGSFTNSLTVASVENSGHTGAPLIFGEQHVFYNETSGYGNEPMTTLGGESYEFVLVDGPGVDDNNNVGQAGDQFLAIGSAVLEGKMALCYRGSSSFFAKANAAMAQGAVGIVIINNTTGAINMNLTGYEYTAPAVSILKADGDAIKANATPVTDPETGDVLYYTGTMSVGAEAEVYSPGPSDTVTVSSFSSWGVPGTLVMKPEILAPGGSIYSVWGANIASSSPTDSHEDYELMSGTSMASPQVAGMAAVLGQYIRDNDLCTKTGRTQRQLINSLLMSTAHPVYDDDGEYWPVIRVGAGLANVGDATMATSYIMMDENSTLFPDTARDGKVKAELGDDPERNGVYEYTFTVYPLNDSKMFNLRTETFVQAIAGNAGYGVLQDTQTARFEDYFGSAPDVTYVIDEQEYIEGEGFIITEPTTITVRIALTDTDKMWLDYYWTGGAYIQGYTYLDPIADEEGVFDDVTHSIPFLAYYGSWTDAAMLDRTSVIDEAYGTGKLPYIANSVNANFLSLKNANGVSATYMGNPYMIEEKFPADRLAMNSDDTIEFFNYLNIRNAATLGFAVLDEEGKVLYAQANAQNKYSAYYYVNGATWQNTSPSKYNVNKKLSATGVQEGDVVTVGFFALPEYYSILNAKLNGTVATQGGLDNAGFKKVLEEGGVGAGAGLTYTVKIDNKAPEIVSATHDLVTGEIAVKAQDDNYIAYVAVTNKSGSNVFAEMLPEQAGPNEIVDVPMEFGDQVKPSEVVILVGDYAGNESAYSVSLGGEGGTPDFGGTVLVFTAESLAPGAGPRAWAIDVDELSYNYSSSNYGPYTGISVFGTVPAEVRAAEYVDGYIFMAAVDGWLYAAPINELDTAARITQYEGTIYDMAFNYADGKLYALGEENKIYTVDLVTGEMDLVATVSIHNPRGASYQQLVGMTIDDEGNFYGANKGSTTYAYLFKWTLDEVVVPERDVNLDGVTDEADAQAVLDKVSGALAADAAFDAAVADVDGDRLITSKDARLLLTAGNIGAIEAVNPTNSGNMGIYFNGMGGSLGWDHDNDKLYATSNYWSSYSSAGTPYDYDHYLWVVDTETGKAARANMNFGSGTSSSNPSARLANRNCGLIFVPGKDSIIKPTDEAAELLVEPAELVVMKGNTAQLVATVKPWTLTDKTVTWASADENIATVSDTGLVTGVTAGETVITVTTVAAPNLSVDVPVTVKEPPEVELRGVIWDEHGKGMASVFSSLATNDWTGLAEFGQMRWGALNGDVFYGSDEDNIYWFDADTYEQLGQISMGQYTSILMPSDAAPLDPELAAAIGMPSAPVAGLAYNGTRLWLIDTETVENTSGWNLTNLGMSDAAAVIAFMGYEDYDLGDEYWEEAAKYAVITESGELYFLHMSWEGSLTLEDVGKTPLDLSGVSDVSNSTWASMVYDADSEFYFISLFKDGDEVANLYALDANDLSCMGLCGDFNPDVWPVTGLYQYEPLTDLALKVSPSVLKVFEGDTAKVDIRVKMGETNEYTGEVADPEIASFENGVVTGLKAGETDLVITTVDVNAEGEHLSETVHVIVKGAFSLEGTIMAQVTDENGARFTKINLEDLSVSKKGFEAPGSAISGGRGGEYYVADIDGASPIVLDAETFEQVDWSRFSASFYASNPALDFASFPMFMAATNEADRNRFLFTTEAGYLAMPDSNRWELADYIPDMAGLAFAGTDENSDGEEVYDYLLMTTSGDLYLLQVDFRNYSLGMQQLLSTGITVEDPSALSMAYIQNLGYEQENPVVKSSGLVIANNENKALYYVDFMTGELEFFGILDVENVSGLVGTFDDLVQVDELPIEIPEVEPIDPGFYPEPNPEIVGIKQAFYFETDPAEEGWLFFDRDHDGNNWQWNTSWEPYEGSGMLSSFSYENSSYSALYPNNYAVSPALDLSAYDDANVAVYAKGQDPSYAAEVFAFYAGTYPDPSVMTKISPDFTMTGDWQKYTASLADFAGESEVYVAIRHYNCTDMFAINVDQFMLLTADGAAEPEPPAPPEALVSFDFEDDAAGWTFVDSDGDGKNWAVYESSYYANDGTKSISSVSWDSSGALTPDNWAVSPAIDLSGVTEAQLGVYAVNLLSSYPETIALYAGITPNVANMTQIKGDFEPTGTYKQYTADLSAFAGQSTVYVAIRHYNCTDAYRVCVDTVEILVPASEGDHAPFSPCRRAAETKSYAAPEMKFAGLQMERMVDLANNVPDTIYATKGDAGRHAEGSAFHQEATVTLSELETATNGLMYVKYNPALLTLTNVESNIELHSINTEEGKVYFAYASANVIPAGTELAKLTFSYEVEELNTRVMCHTYERGDDIVVREDPVVLEFNIEEHAWEETERVEPTCTEDGYILYTCAECGDTKTEVLPALGHAWAEPEWDWESAEDLVYVSFVCDRCGEEIFIETEPITETVEPSCTEDGLTTIYATVELDGVTYTDIHEEIVLPALGHAYNGPEWSWNEDFTAATAKFVCGVCEDELELEAEVVTETIDPKCEVEGKIVHTATVVLEDVPFTDVQEEIIPALEHEWEITKEIPATCTSDGIIVKTCAICGKVETEDLPATGHAYGEPEWVWTKTDDGYTAVAKFTCANCGDVQTVEAEVTAEIVDADCGNAGSAVYTATVEFEENPYTDTLEETLPANGHSYGEPEWDWDSDENLVYAIFACEVCDDTYIIETEPTVEVIPPSCTEPGKIVKTATVELNGEIFTDVKEFEGEPATGHVPGEAVRENVTDATCTEAGGYDEVVYCTVCGEELSRETKAVEALGHKFGEWAVTTEPNCTEAGVETRVCERCGEEETRPVDALGHSYGEPEWTWTKTDDGYTATAKFVCSVCGDEQIVDATVTAEISEADCVTPSTAIYTASVEFEGKPYEDSKQDSIPASGHVYGKPVWKWNKALTSATATFTCAKCGDVQKLTATVTSEETKPATTTEEGIMTYTAKVDFEGKTYTDTKTQTIPKLEPENHEEVCPCKQFVDMPEIGTPEHNAIDWAYTHKPQITSGMDATHFGTEVVVNRAQAMVFLWAAKNKPAATSTESPFVDVKKTDWFYKAVMWAVDNNITSGTDSTHFSPNKTCNRSEILGFLYAAMGKPKVSIANPYSDVSSQWYKKAALWAYSKGIEKGENGKFNASTPCTRAAVVLYLYRFETGKDLAE